MSINLPFNIYCWLLLIWFTPLEPNKYDKILLGGRKCQKNYDNYIYFLLNHHTDTFAWLIYNLMFENIITQFQGVEENAEEKKKVFCEHCSLNFNNIGAATQYMQDEHGSAIGGSQSVSQSVLTVSQSWQSVSPVSQSVLTVNPDSQSILTVSPDSESWQWVSPDSQPLKWRIINKLPFIIYLDKQTRCKFCLVLCTER